LIQQIVGHGSAQGLAGAENPDAFFLGQRRTAAHRSKGNVFADTFQLQQVSRSNVQFRPERLGQNLKKTVVS
jgi:hypothetical protein